MTHMDSKISRRSFAQIEADLVAAEEEYSKAHQMIEDAKRRFDDALAQINTYQREFDEALSVARKSSTPGTLWGSSATEGGAILALRSEDELCDPSHSSSISSERVNSDTALSSARKSIGDFQLLKSQTGSIEAKNRRDA